MIIRLLLILNLVLFNNTFSQEREKFINQKIIFATRENYPYTSSNPFDSGYFIELTKKALEYSNIKSEYIFVSNDQAVQLIKEGKIDAIIGISETENDSLIMSNSAWLETSTGVYALENYVGTVSEVYHLYNKIVGFSVDLPLESKLKKILYNHYIKKPNMFKISSGFDSIEENIKLLKDKEIDVFLEDENVMNNYIKNSDVPIKKVGSLSEKFKIYVAFSATDPKTQKYMKLLDSGIMIMKNSGELKEIEDNYLHNILDDIDNNLK